MSAWDAPGRNSEGYPDPTAERAISRADRKGKRMGMTKSQVLGCIRRRIAGNRADWRRAAERELEYGFTYLDLLDHEKRVLEDCAALVEKMDERRAR